MFAALIAIDAAPQITLEFLPGADPRLAAFTSLLTLYLHLFATFRTLILIGLDPPDRTPRRPTDGRYPAAFLLSLLTLIGILVGLVLLIVPGLWLLTIWCIALPALAAERIGVVDALRRSRALVRPRMCRFAWLVATWLGGFVVVLAPAVIAGAATQFETATATAIADFCFAIYQMVSCVYWTIAYAAARAEEECPAISPDRPPPAPSIRNSALRAQRQPRRAGDGRTG